jgi:hypothetical protein
VLIDRHLAEDGAASSTTTSLAVLLLVSGVIVATQPVGGLPVLAAS